MKNKIIKLAILLVVVFVSGLVSASVITDLTLKDGNVLTVWNKVLNKESIQMFKVVDGTNTCYVTKTTINNVINNLAISCIR